MIYSISKPRNKSFLTLLLFLFLPILGHSQVWPYTPMIRLGNAVYIDTNQEKLAELDQKTILLEKGLENRYFDILTLKDSLKIEIDNQDISFSQKQRKVPENGKTVLYYSRRKLRNANHKITYLKLIEIKDRHIIAEATIKNKSSRPQKNKKMVRIDIEEIEGIFVGPKNGMRTASYVIGIGAGLAILFLI